MAIFIKNVAKLIEKGALDNEVIESVYNARRATHIKFGKQGFRGDSLSSLIVVSGDVAAFGGDLAAIREAGSVGLVKAKQEAYATAKIEIKKARTPAEAIADVVAAKSSLTFTPEAVTLADKANEKILPVISQFMDDYSDWGQYDESLLEETGLVQKFIYQAVKYFDFKTNNVKKHGTKIGYSPLVPVIATAILARNVVPDQSDDDVSVGAEHIERFLTPYIAALIDAKKVGNQYADPSLGDNDPANMQVIVSDAVKLVDKLLAEVEHKDELEAASREERIEIRKNAKSKEVAGNYLHDIALYRKLVENTLNINQVLNGIEADDPSALGYVGYKGLLLPVFSHKYTRDENLNKGITEKYGDKFSAILSFTENDENGIWNALKAKIEAEGDLNPNLSALKTAIYAIMLANYSGCETEEMQQLVEAYADVYVEVQANYKENLSEFSKIVKEYVKEVKADLIQVRDEVLPKAWEESQGVAAHAEEESVADGQVFTADDSEALITLAKGLAGLEGKKVLIRTTTASDNEKTSKRARQRVFVGVLTQLSEIATNKTYKVYSPKTGRLTAKTLELTDQEQAAVLKAYAQLGTDVVRGSIKKYIVEQNELTQDEENVIASLPEGIKTALNDIGDIKTARGAKSASKRIAANAVKDLVNDMNKQADDKSNLNSTEGEAE